jgi:hypothetical protein
MRVLVCGGRKYGNITYVATVLSKLHRERGIDAVIHGAAPGADLIAATWARHNNVEQVSYAADWTTHGRAAGPIRNQIMLDQSRPDLVLAFPGGRGTADLVARAKKAGVEVEICEPTLTH